MFVAGFVGCGRGTAAERQGSGSSDVVRCYMATGSSAMCIERFDPLNDTLRLAATVQCREQGGSVVETCPTKNFVGACESKENPKLAWTLNRTTRANYYLHPDAASPDALARIDAISKQCEKWTAAK